MTLVESFLGQRARPHVPATSSLRNELFAAGLTPMSTERVHEHIRQMNRFNRPSVWHWALFVIARVVWCCTLEPLLRQLLIRRSPELLDPIVAIIMTVGAGVSAAGYMLTGHHAFLMALVPLGALMLTMLFFVVVLLFGTFDLLATVRTWYRIPFQAAAGSNQLPAEVARDGAVAETIPGVKVSVLTLDDDPFLEVRRGRWPHHEQVFIAAWDTGDPELNTVHRISNGAVSDYRHPLFGGEL